MQAGRGESVAALVVGAGALLITCVFGFLSLTPGIDPAVGDLLQFGFFGGGIVTLGAFAAYFIASRRSASGRPVSQFDRLLEHRKAALAAVPIGLGAVLVGVLWYMARRMGEWSGSGVNPAPGATAAFASIDTAGIAAFLAFGSLYLIVAIYVAIRSERAAIRVAREEAEVSL